MGLLFPFDPERGRFGHVLSRYSRWWPVDAAELAVVYYAGAVAAALDSRQRIFPRFLPFNTKHLNVKKINF